jgi:hypothetical protein
MSADKFDKGDATFPVERDNHTKIIARYLEPHSFTSSPPPGPPRSRPRSGGER